MDTGFVFLKKNLKSISSIRKIPAIPKIQGEWFGMSCNNNRNREKVKNVHNEVIFKIQSNVLWHAKSSSNAERLKQTSDS